MQKVGSVSSEIPDSVNSVLVEVRDEFLWLTDEFSQLLDSGDLVDFADVLDGVMEYAEDFHSALEKLEKEVNKGESK